MTLFRIPRKSKRILPLEILLRIIFRFAFGSKQVIKYSPTCPPSRSATRMRRWDARSGCLYAELKIQIAHVHALRLRNMMVMIICFPNKRRKAERDGKSGFNSASSPSVGREGAISGMQEPRERYLVQRLVDQLEESFGVFPYRRVPSFTVSCVRSELLRNVAGRCGDPTTPFFNCGDSDLRWVQGYINIVILSTYIIILTAHICWSFQA